MTAPQYLLENLIILPAEVQQLKQFLEVPPLGPNPRTAQTTPQMLPTLLVFNPSLKGKAQVVVA